MKYKVGDQVRIKSLEWYNKNKDKRGNISFPYEAEVVFTSEMSSFCGHIVTISQKGYTKDIGFYRLADDNGSHIWTDEMIEGLVETPKFKEGDCVKCSDGSCGIIVTCDWSDSLNCYQYYISYIGTLDAGYQPEKDLQPHTITTMNGRDIFEGAKWKHEFECPDGYQFVDENGNIINATKIVLEKKKKEYPKTYKECCKVMDYCCNPVASKTYHKEELIRRFQFLLLYRDAYWKLYGEENELGKPWEPNWTSFEGYPAIYMYRYQITLSVAKDEHHLLVFPSAEMRDAFYENFKSEIESCKELL